MTDDDADVKDLLGRAFGEEPPLRIDRDEVIGQGRKRLRRKRFFEAGSVVAAVVVAAVGAATLTNLADSEPDRLPPAASSTLPAPVGPNLPLTTTPSGPVSPPSATTGLPSIEKIDPNQLTAMLYAAGIVSQKEVDSLSGQSGVPKFVLVGGQYLYQADLRRSNGQGFLQVMVGASDTIGGDCRSVAPPAIECEVRDKHGAKVVVNHFDDGDGQRRTTAFVVRPDGLRIYAMATNTITRASNTPADGAPPVLSDDELCILVTKVGSSA